jgi:hypothetical protein
MVFCFQLLVVPPPPPPPISLVSTIEELPERKSSGSSPKIRENGSGDIRCADISVKKLKLSSATSSGRSVGIVHSRTQAKGFKVWMWEQLAAVYFKISRDILPPKSESFWYEIHVSSTRKADRSVMGVTTHYGALWTVFVWNDHQQATQDSSIQALLSSVSCYSLEHDIQAATLQVYWHSFPPPNIPSSLTPTQETDTRKHSPIGSTSHMSADRELIPSWCNRASRVPNLVTGWRCY